jgi:O-antigen/teichoic acid export membrane protein
MDLFLMSYFRPKYEVGYYGLAQKIILTIITTIVSITQVISPNFAKVKTKLDFGPHLKSALLYMLIPTAIFLLVLITPNWIFDLVLTKKFTETAGISRWMSLVYIPYSFISLFHLFLLYVVKKPIYILYANLLLFGIISGGCYLYIPRFGAMGAIWSLGAAFMAASVLLVILSYAEYRKLPAA